MASKTVKCNNCNIVINEVLAFVQNKVDIMNEESLVQICTTAFTLEDIEIAKSLLFDSVKTGIRKVSRRNDKKTHRNLDDIISVFKQTDPELTPIFVAKDLQKLPPVTFDHVDVTKLLKDLLILQKDITVMKNNFVTVEQFNVIKNDLQDLKQASVVNTHNFVNTKRGAYLLDTCDSGPIGMVTHIHNESSNVDEASLDTPQAEINLPAVSYPSLSQAQQTDKCITSAIESTKRVEARCVSTTFGFRRVQKPK